MLQRSRKGELTLKILSAVKNSIAGSADLIEAILVSGYGASLRKMEYNLRQVRAKREARELKREKDFQVQQRYYSLLYNLKQDGLIEERQNSGKNFLHLTSRGEEYLKQLQKRIKSRNVLPSVYKIRDSENIVIITFDVPEKERRKRGWLRCVLKNLGMKMIQKSVWLGKIKVPQEFLQDLKKLNMVEYVEVFEVSKTGSLRHIF